MILDVCSSTTKSDYIFKNNIRYMWWTVAILSLICGEQRSEGSQFGESGTNSDKRNWQTLRESKNSPFKTPQTSKLLSKRYAFCTILSNQISVVLLRVSACPCEGASYLSADQMSPGAVSELTARHHFFCKDLKDVCVFMHFYFLFIGNFWDKTGGIVCYSWWEAGKMVCTNLCVLQLRKQWLYGIKSSN